MAFSYPDATFDDELRRKGVAPEEARLAAKRAFGGVEQAKENCRPRATMPAILQLNS